MSKAKMILLLCFVLALAAGGAAGLWAGRTTRPPDRRSWLAQELGLSPEQREQMEGIWSGMARGDGREARSELAERREQAVRALLTPEQLEQYEQIQQEHTRQMETLAQERRQRFEQAVEQTKTILNAEQRAKYEEMLRRRSERGERGERGEPGGWPGRGGRRGGPMTAPAQTPEATTPPSR